MRTPVLGSEDAASAREKTFPGRQNWYTLVGLRVLIHLINRYGHGGKQK
jgi:hypothetical protein